jgi:iron-sulfur cluster repair protein YtfE (RIC family)
MDPIQHLLDEHRDIMARVDELRQAAAELAARGEAALPAVLPKLDRVGQMMETQLALHAKKEDDALFPALEAVFGAGGGPTSVMRMEHRAIHDQGELLRQTLYELNEVEHPQIEAGRERLKALVTSGASAASLRDNAEEILRLLDAHFGKEEQILFPMAQSLLDDETLRQVGREIEQMRIGH